MRRDIVRQDEDRRLQLAHEARVHGCRPATSMVRCPEGEVTQAYARLARNEVWRLVARLRARRCKREGAHLERTALSRKAWQSILRVHVPQADPAHSCFNRSAGSHAGVPSSYWLSVRGRWLEPSAFMMNSSAYGCGWLRTSGDSSL